MWGIAKVARRLSELNDTISDIGNRLAEQLGAMTDEQARIADDVARIAAAQEAQDWYTAGRPTGIRSITTDNQEIDGMTVSNVTVELLPAKPTAVSQIVTVAVAGFQTAELTVPAADTLAKFAVPPGSVVTMTVASRDAAGNTSGAFLVDLFTPVDTIAPDSPDGIGAITVNDTAVPEPGFTELMPV